MLFVTRMTFPEEHSALRPFGGSVVPDLPNSRPAEQPNGFSPLECVKKSSPGQERDCNLLIFHG